MRPRAEEDRLATIYDVAKAAGVSPKTVSRVLNGDTPVNAKTRAAVHAAMERLNYIPSSAARSMRSQKSGLVGIITGAITASPGVAEVAGLPDIFIVQGAQRRFADSRKTVLISDTGGRDSSVPRLVQTFLEHRVEGLVYIAEYRQELEFPAVARDVPVVLANCYDGRGTPSVEAAPLLRVAQDALCEVVGIVRRQPCAERAGVEGTHHMEVRRRLA